MAFQIEGGNTFIHIPRCGGTSVWYKAGDYYHVDGAFHLKINELEEMVGPQREYIIQIRNPYHRFLSFFNFLKMQLGKQAIENRKVVYQPDLDFLDNLTFRDFCYSLQNTELQNKIVDTLQKYNGILRGIPNYKHAYELQYTWFDGYDNVELFKIEHKDIWAYLGEKPIAVNDSIIKEQDIVSDTEAKMIRHYFEEDFYRLKYSQKVV